MFSDNCDQLWDHKVKLLENDLNNLFANFSGNQAVTVEYKKLKNFVSENQTAFFRQIDALLTTQNYNGPLSQNEHTFLRWIKVYADKISNFMSEIQKSMILDLWARLIYVRVLNVFPPANPSSEMFKTAIFAQINVLKNDEILLTKKLEELTKEEKRIKRYYRQLAVIKANRDALINTQMQCNKSLSVMANRLTFHGSNNDSVSQPELKASQMYSAIENNYLGDILSNLSIDDIISSFDEENLS